MPWEAYVPKGIDIISISISGNHNMFFILFCLVRSESMFYFLFLVRSWYDSPKSYLFFLFLFLFHFAMTFFLSLRGLHATNVPTCTVKRYKVAIQYQPHQPQSHFMMDDALPQLNYCFLLKSYYFLFIILLHFKFFGNAFTDYLTFCCLFPVQVTQAQTQTQNSFTFSFILLRSKYIIIEFCGDRSTSTIAQLCRASKASNLTEIYS